jgi:hydrogenase maturation protease
VTTDGVLVVGYGNPLRSDDGVGPAVAARLAADVRMRGVDIRAEHQLTPDLALDASRSSLVVLVDAAEGLAAGVVSVRWLEGAAMGMDPGPPLTHHLDPAGLLGLARELWGTAPPLVVVSVGTATTEIGESLSPLVASAVERAVDAVVGLVGEHARTPGERARA